MAEVRFRFGRGAYNSVHKICNRNLLKSQKKRSKSAVEASCLSAGFLLGEIQGDGLCEAEKGADTVPVGLSQGTYTRVTPLFTAVNGVWDKENVADRQQSRHLFWGHGQLLFIRAYNGNGPRSEPLYKTKTGYYDILGVSPAATQAQIKTAYYKQSFVYHPDRNAGSEEATTRFSDISEAYTVLGNKALRKKYDRGLLSQSDLTTTARPSAKDAGTTAKHQPERRRSVVGEDIQGSIFDFDKFYKSHYNEQLQRERDIRIRKEEILKEKQETIGEKKLGRMMEIGVGMLLVMAVGIIMSLKRG